MMLSPGLDAGQEDELLLSVTNDEWSSGREMVQGGSYDGAPKRSYYAACDER